MLFFSTFIFLVTIFNAQATINEAFLRRCEQEGIVDVEATIEGRLSSPIAELSTYLTKYYAQSLIIALRKNTDVKNKREHEQLRKALQCQLKPCVDSTFDASKFGNISAQLSTSINNLRVKSSCKVLSNYKRSSLNKVAYSNAVKAALNCEHLKETSLKGVLHRLTKLVGDAFGSAQGSVLASLDLDDLLNGLIASVRGLLVSLLEDLEFSLLVGESSVGSTYSSRSVQYEIFNVYKCDLGVGVNRVYCNELSNVIDEVISTVIALREPFDWCLHVRYADILDLHYNEIINC